MKKWDKNYEELILKSTEYSGSRGLDDCGYCAVPKSRIKAINVEKLLKDKDIQSIND